MLESLIQTCNWYLDKQEVRLFCFLLLAWKFLFVNVDNGPFLIILINCPNQLTVFIYNVLILLDIKEVCFYYVSHDFESSSRIRCIICRSQCRTDPISTLQNIKYINYQNTLQLYYHCAGLFVFVMIVRIDEMISVWPYFGQTAGIFALIWIYACL